MYKSLMTTAMIHTSPGSVYYAQVNVPYELQEIVGKIRIYKSLSTKDRDVALAALPAATHEIRNALIQLFRVLLAEVTTTSGVAEGEELCRDIVLTPKSKPYSSAIQAALDQVGLINAANSMRCRHDEALASCQIADRMIIQCRLPIERFSPQYWVFCRAVRRLQRDATFRKVPDTDDSPVMAGRLENGAYRAFLETATLSEVMRRFREEFVPRWSKRHREIYFFDLEVIIELLGELTPIRNLTRSDFRTIRDIVDDLPPRYQTMAALKGLTLRAAAIKAKELGLKGRSFETTNHLMSACSALMSFAMAEGFVDKNCAIGLIRRRPISEAKPIEPFAPDQLNRFFSCAPVYDPAASEHAKDCRFWTPLIALFAGLRMNEITQLETSDILTVDEVPLFSINWKRTTQDGAVKSLKTSYSRRMVPVHPELLRLGFLTYHQQMVESGFIPLFPELRLNQTSRRYEQFSQQITHDLARAGVRSPHHSFRSFRHNFRDAMREADISDETVRRLGGWTLRSIADEYGRGPSMQKLHREVCKVSYPKLDLSHLCH